MQGSDRTALSPAGNGTGGACCYVVRGLGENEPIRVQLSEPDDLTAGIAICDDEIRRMTAAIRVNWIKRPPAISERPPSFAPEIERAETGHEAASVMRCPPGRVAEGRRQYRAGGSLVERARSYMNRQKFSDVADKVVEIAGAKPVLVIGREGRPLASLLCARGTAAADLKPSPPVPSGYQDGRRSLLHWLCDRGNDLADVGAVVLAGDEDFATDLQALADAGAVPPLVEVKFDDQGLPSVASVTPARASEPDDGPWPKISVVTVSFNQAPYLEASIRSILDQGYPNLEYIIVDGGSTDGSVEIIERYRDRCAAVIIEPDRGQSDALNKGFALATGDMMNWLCSDDLLEPGSLFQIGRAYREYGADLIAGGCARIGETRAEEHYRHHTALPLGITVKLLPLDILHFMRSWQKGNYFFQPEVFFSRRIWLASGAYLKEHLFYAMDYDLWLRMALAGATARHIPSMIGCSRIHALQKTQDNRKYLHQLRQLMAEYRDLFKDLREMDIAPSTAKSA